MPFPKRLISIGVALVVLVVMGAGVYLRIRRAEEGEADTGGSRPVVASAGAFSTDVAIPVEGAPVVRDTLVLSVSASGQAAAYRRATVRAQVEGQVTRVLVRESERVGAGALLLEVDPTQYELEVERARAAVASAEASFRELTLFDDRIDDPEVRAERERVARAKSQLDQTRVALREAELRLARTRVRAPFPGRVASVRVVPGQWVQPGDELLTVVDLDPIKVEVQVLEGEVAYLKPGRKATISFAAFPDTAFVGTIETINPVVDEATRTAKVTAMVPNPDGRILPGMYARVSLEAQRFPDRILVPRAAILERDRRPMLFVFEDGRAKWRYVTPGLENETMVEIVPNPETEMVEPGEVVLTNGHYTLIHDARVRLVESVAEAGGRPN
ncbi:MAG TPA: efflux RND transporter periplasmic adaptor subunit [Longimicrobiales bacterium]